MKLAYKISMGLFLKTILCLTTAPLLFGAKQLQPAQIKEYKLEVKNMMCAACVSRVKKSISNHAGVSDVIVSLDSHDATFKCSKPETQCEMDQILKDLKKIQYPAKIKE